EVDVAAHRHDRDDETAVDLGDEGLEDPLLRDSEGIRHGGAIVWGIRWDSVRMHLVRHPLLDQQRRGGRRLTGHRSPFRTSSPGVAHRSTVVWPRRPT